jgi:hypothetical protein
MSGDASSGASSRPDQPGTDGEQTATLAAASRESESAARDLDAPEFGPVTADDLTREPIIGTIKPGRDDIKTEAWNPDQFTAFTQSRVTFRLIWVLGGVLVLGAALLSTTPLTKITAQDVTDFFGIAFGAVVTLVTAATSFWFGTERGRRDQGRK